MNLSIKQKRLLEALLPGSMKKPAARSATVFQARHRQKAAQIKVKRLLEQPPVPNFWKRLRERLKVLCLKEARRCRRPAPAPFPPGVSAAPTYGPAEGPAWAPKSFGERCPVCHGNPNHQCQHCAGNGLGPDFGQKKRAEAQAPRPHPSTPPFKVSFNPLPAVKPEDAGILP